MRSEPVSIYVDTFCTGCGVSDADIEKRIPEHFDLTPRGIIKTLDLLRPIYFDTAAYGHFGRDGFSWERCDRVEKLKEAFA